MMTATRNHALYQHDGSTHFLDHADSWCCSLAFRPFEQGSGSICGQCPQCRPEQDRTTSPELERFLANRMHAKTIEVDASHLSLITHPQEITDLIVNAAGRRG
jgi:hypothetical protein